MNSEEWKTVKELKKAKEEETIDDNRLEVEKNAFAEKIKTLYADDIKDVLAEKEKEESSPRKNRWFKSLLEKIIRTCR